MKIVINSCYGGFGLSDTAVLRYAELKGITLYREDGPCSITHFYTIPVTEYHKIHDECKSSRDYTKCNGLYFSYREIERTDSHLIQTVMELGKLANGMCADLTVIDIPDDIEYTIQEYDGNEHIAESHRTWG